MKRQKTTVVITRNGKISMKIVKSTLKGEARRTRPKTSVKLVRLEPMMPPMASWVLPRLAAVRSSVSSGREVPIATIFAPTRIDGAPKATAMLEAEFTVAWADNTTMMKLARRVPMTTSFLRLLMVVASPFGWTGGVILLEMRYVLTIKQPMSIAPMI